MENQEVKPETTTPETPATPEQPVSPTGGPPKKTKPKWIVPAIIVAGIIILGAAAVILLTECCVDRRYEQDSRRIGDLRIITLALEMYYDDYGRFPENLEELEQEPAYIAKTPKDPKSEEVYKYVLIEDNKVILRTILDNTNNSILAEDEDGTISGLDCQDPAYCLIYETKEVNDNCAKEGESPTYLDLTTGLEVPDGKYCCSGLKAIGPKTSQAQLEKGMCAKITGSLGVCRPCGNDVCDSN